MKVEEVVASLKAKFPQEIPTISSRSGVLARVEVKPSAIVPVCTWLRDEGTFTHCAMVGGIDWRETREVLYLLWSDTLRTYLELFCQIPGSDAAIDSVAGVWGGANWHERETWDLVGIKFNHHPDLRRLLLPEGYQFHPLLKSMELHEPEDLEVKVRRE